MFKNLSIVLLLIVFFHTNEAHAKVRGEVVLGSVYSKVLAEQRELIIHLPNNYRQNSELHYPVLYLLDGLRNFNHTAGTLDILNQDGKAQEMIIIAIKNTHRTRDLTPTYDESYNEWGISGGADNFLDFIEEELIPYVDQHYRTNKFKIIAGHSFGGLLAVYAFQSRPELFQAHFAFSPSLWWHNNRLLPDAEKLLANTPELASYLYMNLGNETGNMLSAFEQYTAILAKYQPKGFSYHSEINKSETHGTTAMVGQTLAFRYLEQSLQCPKEIVAQGIPAIQEFFKKQSEKYGYSITPSYRAINHAGYNALAKKDREGAIKAFKLNVKNYPYKADAYDSLADGLTADGQLKEALKMRELTIKKSLIENVENNAYKTRLTHLRALINRENAN
jgi:predicted alpha/beta superfamily hydrolase